MSVLTTYQPLIDINPAKKSFLNQAGSSYNATPTGTMSWRNTKWGRAVSFGATGYLSITRDATLDAIDDFTILIFGEIPTQLTGSNIHIFNKGSGYQFYYPQGTGILTLFSGLTTSSSSIDVRGAQMIGVTLTSGQRPRFYKNGNYGATGDNPLTPASNTTDIGIGNYSPSASDSYNAEGKFFRILFFDEVLNDEVISEIYNEIMTNRGAGDPKTRNYKGFMPPIDTNCVLAYDMETKTGDGKMADLSGNGKHGTIAAALGQRVLSSGFKGISPSATGNITFTSTNFGTTHTFETIFENMKDETIFFGGGAYYFFYVTSGKALVYYANALSSTSWAISPIFGSGPYHVVMERNGTSVTLYVNGVSLGTETLSNNAAQVVDTVTTSAWPLTGVGMGYCQIYSDSKGATWAKNRYDRYAKKLTYDSQPEYWTPTLANVTAGRIGNTDFSVSTGTWKVSEDANKQKWIENVGAGLAYMPFNKAYGTWIFDLYKALDGSTSQVQITNTQLAGDYSDYGYTLYFSPTEQVGLSYTSGLNVMYTANSYIAIATKYKIAISRTNAGVFNVYIKGGVYTSWTLVSVAGGGGANPATNTTHTTSKFMSMDFDAGDKISDINHFNGVLDLSTLPNI